MGLNKGFDVNFLGEEHPIPFPRLREDIAQTALEGGRVFPFTHFSIVMNKARKFAVYGANNTDVNLDLRLRRCNDWHLDNRIGEENQVGNWLYAGGNEDLWDRGHLVRRDDVGWGEEAEGRDADCDSFCFANIAPQHKEFHHTEWGEIEKWIIEKTKSKNKKLSIFTGPIFTDNDREYCGFRKPLGCGIHIPAGFWKVAFYIGNDEQLHSAAFKILQDDFWRNGVDFHHASGPLSLLARMDILTKYQVPLTSITEVTGLEFEDHLYETNPLFFEASDFTERMNIITPEIHMIRGPADLILDRS
ncbi:DNA/RNA non-specific endonuclease [Paenibacillus sambharensis]|uniref:DNA/RNA non-specific endonuclease n=1 Tax=Paenibacillus sambharensis TaxID=1803190 RepID=A0A2W1L9D4_9BACL|nr:DNA/RNA non-specific endonuclease [Paenibacillus sambharensis]PZD95846.1 DNA/RNA non-specific endonuclease [Paenibacillus sambharensis]